MRCQRRRPLRLRMRISWSRRKEEKKLQKGVRKEREQSTCAVQVRVKNTTKHMHTAVALPRNMHKDALEQQTLSTSARANNTLVGGTREVVRTKKLLKLCEKKEQKSCNFIYYYDSYITTVTVYTANRRPSRAPRAFTVVSAYRQRPPSLCRHPRWQPTRNHITPTYHDGSHPCIPAVRIPNCHYKRQRCSGKTTDGLAELVFQRVQRASRRSVGLQQLYNILFYANPTHSLKT